MSPKQYLLLEASTRHNVVTINIISNETIEVVTRHNTELLDYEIIAYEQIQSIIKEIEGIANMKIEDIVTIYNSDGNRYYGIGKPLSKVLHDLQNGYTAIPF